MKRSRDRKETMMIDRTTTIVGALWVVTALGLPGLAATAEKGAADPLERVRALEGEWVAAED